MRFFLFILITLTSFSAWSSPPDFSKRFGIAVSLGRDKPILGNRFDDRADGEFVFGGYLRYQINRESGLQFGYTRFEWSHSPTAARVYDLMYIHRLTPRQYFTPIWGVSAGAVDIANYNVDENLKLALRARAGLEYVLHKDLLLSAYVDYLFINKMIGESRNLTIGEIHALAPQLSLAYFFP